MIDGIIKADGTSRLMRATLPATYEEFKAQAAAGTLPLDILFNEAGWSQLPTFLNKANLLKDLTANLFGLGADAVPDDVFGVLSRFQNGLGNEYVWDKQKVTKTAVLGSATTLTSRAFATTSNHANTMYASDPVDLIEGRGTKLASSGLSNSAVATLMQSELRGKYVQNTNVSGAFMYFSKTATISLSGTNYVVNSCLSYTNPTVKTDVQHIDYVNSPNPNAYPVDDGYTYTALGQLGNKVQIATGSYTGTGTYGKNNPTVLTFDFAPKLVIVTDGEISGGGDYADFLLWVPGVATVKKDYGNTCYVTVSGNKISWYAKTTSNSYPTHASYQYNESGTKYYWLVLG